MKTKVKKLFNVYGYTGGNYGGNVYAADGLAPTIINFGSGGNRQPIIMDFRYIGMEGEPRVYEDVALNINARDYKSPLQVSENRRLRKLTPRECWRLMGFTDEDFAKAEKVNSNTQLYKQAGNSIVVPVLEAIFRQMLEGENNEG